MVPMGDVGDLGTLRQEVEENLGLEVEVMEGVRLPESAYHSGREQYDGSMLLSTLEDLPGRGKSLGVTGVDLFAGELNFIFGLAQIGGDKALISLHRLVPRTWERALKEATHEIGHTLGMTHCLDPVCVMSFSNSIAEVDRKGSGFCARHEREFLTLLWREVPFRKGGDES